MTSPSLAILGGDPVRTTPFVVGPMVGAEEEELVLAALRNHNFSRYIGSGGPELDRELRMPSKDAADISAPWHFLGGPNVRAFAAEFADKFGAAFAIPVNSATTGLATALAACGVGGEAEVIIPALSFSATGSAPLLFNSTPIFVDVDPRTFCIDPDAVERAITPRTKAIMPVHLLGNVADMTALVEIAEKHGLKIVEDAAQAPGARWRGRYAGTIGDAGVFSFQQSKNIMTGEGGMILTDDPEVARRARLIANHGEAVLTDNHTDADLTDMIGMNFRMPELCAAVGRAQLAKLDRVNDWRNANYRILIDRLAALPGLTAPHVPNDVDFVCHVVGLLYDAEETGLARDLLVAALKAEGIPVGTGYARTMYENPTFLRKIAYAGGAPWSDPGGGDVNYARGQCPVAEGLLYERFLWLYHIAHPSTAEDMDDIARAFEKVLSHVGPIVEREAEIRATGMGARTQGRL